MFKEIVISNICLIQYLCNLFPCCPMLFFVFTHIIQHPVYVYSDTKFLSWVHDDYTGFNVLLDKNVFVMV